NLLAVGTPPRLRAAALGYLILAASSGRPSWKCLDVYLERAGLIRGICDPALRAGWSALWARRELTKGLVEGGLQERRRFPVSIERQHPQIRVGLGIVDAI